MEKDIPIPHPTETPKEKNFDMKRETPIHVNSHLNVRLTRSILTKQLSMQWRRTTGLMSLCISVCTQLLIMQLSENPTCNYNRHAT